jgi:cell division septum initiation protein DivIVA
VAAALVGGCGGDDAIQDVKDQANEVRHDIREGASTDEIKQKLNELEYDAKDKGEDARREAKKLRKELEKQLP